jgi:hypothetical protein
VLPLEIYLMIAALLGHFLNASELVMTKASKLGA